jgi:Notch-like protein
VDECAALNPCQNHGTCQNTEGAYECICVNGFIGRNCETNKDDCVEGSCLNGGVCHDRVGGFYCECPKGESSSKKDFPHFLLLSYAVGTG